MTIGGSLTISISAALFTVSFPTGNIGHCVGLVQKLRIIPPNFTFDQTLLSTKLYFRPNFTFNQTLLSTKLYSRPMIRLDAVWSLFEKYPRDRVKSKPSLLLIAMGPLSPRIVSPMTIFQKQIHDSLPSSKGSASFSPSK